MSRNLREKLKEAVDEIHVLFAEVRLLKTEVTRAQTILNSARYSGQGIDSATAAKGAADAVLQEAVENLIEKIVAAENLRSVIQTRAPGSQAESQDMARLIAILEQLVGAAPGSVNAAAAPPVGAPGSVNAAAAASVGAEAPPPGSSPAVAALLADSTLPQGKQESLWTGVATIAAGGVGVAAGYGGAVIVITQLFLVVITGLFVVTSCTSRSNKKHKGGASTLKKSLSLNLLKSKSISSEKKQIAGRVFNTLLKEAELNYPGIIHLSKKIDPDVFNLEVNKLSKILTKNEIISLASQIFGTEIIQRIIKLVNSGKSVRMNTIRNRKNMYKENNYYPSASIAI